MNKIIKFVFFICILLIVRNNVYAVYAYEYPVGGSGVQNNGSSTESSNNGCWNAKGRWGTYSLIRENKISPPGKYYYAKERGISFPEPIAANENYEIEVSAIGYAEQPSYAYNIVPMNIQVQYQVENSNTWYTLTRGILSGYNDSGYVENGSVHYVNKYYKKISINDWPSYAVGKRISGLRIVVTNFLKNPSEHDLYCIDSFDVYVNKYDNPSLQKKSIEGAAYQEGNTYWFGKNSNATLTTNWKGIYTEIKETYCKLYSANSELLLSAKDVSKEGGRIIKKSDYLNDIRIENKSLSDYDKITLFKFKFVTGKENDFCFKTDANNFKGLWALNKGKKRSKEEIDTNPIDTGLVLKTDFTNPVINVSNYSLGWNRKDVRIIASAEDSRSGIRSFETYMNDKIIPNSSSKANILLNNDGVFVLKFIAKDNVGNNSNTVKTVKIDKTAPVINMKSLGWQKGSSTITASAEDKVSGVKSIKLYDKSGNLLQASNSNLNYLIKEPGINRYKIISEDNAGNTSEKYVITKIDNTAPDGTVSVEFTNDNLSINMERVIENQSGLAEVRAILENDKGKQVTISLNDKYKYPLLINEDLNGNGIVDNADLDIIKKGESNYNSQYNGDYDLNQDGIVDNADLNLVKDKIGKSFPFNKVINISSLLGKDTATVRITIVATDVVGNEKMLYSNTKDLFDVKATIVNQSNNTNQFKRGEYGSLDITTTNYVEKLKVTFSKLDQLNKIIIIKSPSILNKTSYKFKIPLDNVEDGEYKVTVEAIKNNKSKYAFPTLQVGDSIINELETRIRIKGR